MTLPAAAVIGAVSNTASNIHSRLIGMDASLDYAAGLRDLERRSTGQQSYPERLDTVIRGRQRLSIKRKNRNPPDYPKIAGNPGNAARKTLPMPPTP